MILSRTPVLKAASPRKMSDNLNHNYFLYADDIELLYCYIPKNACTIFKYFMLENSSQSNRLDNMGELREIHDYSTCLRVQPDNKYVLTSNSTFKYVVLRNPYSRLWSAYLNKVVEQQRDPAPYVVSMLEKISEKKGNTDSLDHGISFIEFVDYIIDTNNGELNDHWAPQTEFVGTGVVFDLFIRFEDLEAGLLALEKQTGKIFPRKKKIPNQIKYNTSTLLSADYSAQLPIELQQLARKPTAREAYTEGLVEKVARRYKADIDLYESTFDLSATDILRP